MGRPAVDGLLKDGPRRSVSTDRSGTLVVKRFHDPALFGSLRDRLRARREFRMLLYLARSGLPVPAPLDLRRRDHGWEVLMARIQNAEPLAVYLAERREPAGGWSRLLTTLGRILARLELASVDWPDLHAGNVLVDGRGNAWLVDFHHARVTRGSLNQRRCIEHLIRFAALSRESLPARLRLRFVVAWKRELARSPDLPEGLRFSGAALERIERQARELRRSLVEKGAGRWLRSSSRVRVEEDAKGITIERVESSASAFHGPALAVEGLSCAEARARWIQAVRLEEHGIPVLRPLRLQMWAEKGSVFFERASLAPPWLEQDPERVRARFVELLRDRGLALETPSDAELFALPAGGSVLVPPRSLLALDLEAETSDPISSGV